MLILQNKINDILNDKFFSSSEKKILLKDLFLKEGVEVFSDFDDTLSDNSCVFYTKINLLKLFHKDSLKMREKLIHEFVLNPKFPLNIGTVVVISRSDNLFLEQLLNFHFDYLASLGICVIGVVGQTDSFVFSSKEKLQFLPYNTKFIGDVFEHKNLKQYSCFCLVDTLSWFKMQFIKIKKIFILLNFLIRCI